MRLLLIRHGQTPSNVTGILDAAAPGPGLTSLGEQQAAALPAALATERIERIYVSQLTRTALTAAPLAAARGLEPTVLTGLAEIGAGDLQGRADRDAVLEYIQVVFAWSQGDLGVRMPGGEDGEEFVARYDAAIERIAAEGADSPGATAVAFSHAAAIRTWASLRAVNIDASSEAFYQVDNTGVVALDGGPGDWRVTSWNGRPIGGEQLADPSASDPADAPVGGTSA